MMALIHLVSVFFYSFLTSSLVVCLKHESTGFWQKPLASPDQGDGVIRETFNFSSPAPHVFSSLRSLLNQWPSTFFSNGFSIVPCEVGPHTNLYHGRRDGVLPPSPEWFAFDLEMSTAIMGSSRNSHLLTYQTTKTVKCLYFDGMSAALMGTGQLDSQMVFIHGNTTGPPQKDHFRGIFDEYDRADRLCKWVHDNGLGGLGWGIEGIVRMNAGFEMIWCNFSSPSIQILTHLNITTPLLPDGYWDDGDDAVRPQMDMFWGLEMDEIRDRGPQPPKSLFPIPSSTRNDPTETPGPDMPPPPSMRDSFELEPFMKASGLEWFRSATWHYGASGGIGPGQGEDRIKLLTSGFSTFYHPQFSKLASSIAEVEREELNLTTDGHWKGPGAEDNRTLALQQLTRRRRNHNLEGIDQLEAPHMNTAVQRILLSLNATDRNHNSGTDWHLVSAEIGTRYSIPLSQVEQTILDLQNVAGNTTLTKLYMFKTRSKMHSLMVPFLEYPAHTFKNTTLSRKDWSLASDFGQITFSRCKYGHTRLMYNSSGKLNAHISLEEKLIIESIEEVLSGICSTIIHIGLAVEYEWLTRYNQNLPASTSTSNSAPSVSSNLTEKSHEWHTELQELQAWLGWASDHVRCETLCARDEYCFIPMWPVMFFGGIPRRPPPPPLGNPYNRTWHPRYPDPRKGGRGGGRGRGRPPPYDWYEELWNPRCIKMDV